MTSLTHRFARRSHPIQHGQRDGDHDRHDLSGGVDAVRDPRQGAHVRGWPV